MESTIEQKETRSPTDFLNSIKGKMVLVKLNSGVDYKGILACLDGFMNIAMEQTEVRVYMTSTQRWCVLGITCWISQYTRLFIECMYTCRNMWEDSWRISMEIALLEEIMCCTLVLSLGNEVASWSTYLNAWYERLLRHTKHELFLWLCCERWCMGYAYIYI